MKVLALVLVLAAVAFASDTITGRPGGIGRPLPGTDDVLDTYAYNSAEVFSSIPASYTDYAVVDDFAPTQGCEITSYTAWAVTTAAIPTELELLVVADSSSVPSGAPISQTAFPATVTDSGFTFGSYTVYLAVLDLGSDPLYVDTGDTVWLGTHRADGNNWYPACGTTVTGVEAYRTLAAGWAWEPISNSLESGDLFKIIEGDVSLERTTWAGIKNMF